MESGEVADLLQVVLNWCLLIWLWRLDKRVEDLKNKYR